VYRKTGFFGKIRFLQRTDSRLTEYWCRLHQINGELLSNQWRIGIIVMQMKAGIRKSLYLPAFLLRRNAGGYSSLSIFGWAA